MIYGGQYSTDAGEHLSMNCDVCGSSMSVERIVMRRQSRGSEPTLCDIFTCQYKDEQWHKHVDEMQQWKKDCPSPSVCALVENDIASTLTYITNKD